jgi:hypothetical protein
MLIHLVTQWLYVFLCVHLEVKFLEGENYHLCAFCTIQCLLITMIETQLSHLLTMRLDS